MQSNPTILIAVVCGFLAILLGMVALVIYSARKSNAQYAQVAQVLGFKPLENTDELYQKVAFVRDFRADDEHHLTQAFCHTHAFGVKTCMYNLSFRSHSRTGSGSGRKSIYQPLESNALAFISPAWKLPRFQAFPRFSGNGAMTKFANTMAEKAMDIKHELIQFPHIPNLDERYILTTLDLPASQVQPPDGFLRVLASDPNLNLHMGGDTLTISYVKGRTDGLSVDNMKQLYQIGMALARELG